MRSFVFSAPRKVHFDTVAAAPDVEIDATRAATARLATPSVRFVEPPMITMRFGIADASV